MTSAPYGALAVRDRHANLISFVHEGMDAETVRRIGHHPVGKGLLSLSLLDTPALRMDDLTAHPAAAGFPSTIRRCGPFSRCRSPSAARCSATCI